MQTACNAAGNVTAPCCRADFNKVGGITASDLFDYINAWFARDLLADFDGNGTMPPDSSSLVNFVNAWFAGGCG